VIREFDLNHFASTDLNQLYAFRLAAAAAELGGWWVELMQMQMNTSNACTRQRRDTWLDGTGFTVLPATHTFIHQWNEPSCMQEIRPESPMGLMTTFHYQMTLMASGLSTRSLPFAVRAHNELSERFSWYGTKQFDRKRVMSSTSRRIQLILDRNAAVIVIKLVLSVFRQEYVKWHISLYSPSFSYISFFMRYAFMSSRGGHFQKWPPRPPGGSSAMAPPPNLLIVIILVYLCAKNWYTYIKKRTIDFNIIGKPPHYNKW